ncbi:HNH endonuclease signature motif containing protein [Phycicoccus sp. Root101]|uniref:HNH endonuclease signature motif containing protein n=1 Tax=Phycicoccus sp. Root101 TaxID=1736421 RepID=UPI0007032DAD|nr:HNH endonuclease signature motif containing protein [Phycicoccus sp. Root101]KQU70278.1 hypothetical protein ASC58_00075 [Phycicoccus sp. Root101]
MAVAPQEYAGQGGDHPARPVLGALSSALVALTDSQPERLWALSEGEVVGAVRALGELSATVDAHLVAVLAEAKARGLGTGDGWGPVDWARSLAPLLPLRTLTDADTVARAARDPRLGPVVEAATTAATREIGDPDTATGVLPVGKAAQLVRFHRSVAGLADPDQLDEALGTLLDGATGPRGLSERDLAICLRRTGDLLRPDGLVERDADTVRAHRSLTKARGPVGLSRYTLLLDDEGAAVVDAAVEALARPHRDEDTGELDHRTPAARRADALVDLVTRAVSAPDGLPRQARTTMLVTVPLEVLQRRARGDGLTLTGDVLTTDAVRRLACDAEVVPVVLGSRGEVLDQGTAVRLFTTAQIRHLWVRDRHCTFPGCSKPARWTDAHHLVHWADGGRTDIDNAALLCRAHHTVVHRERLRGAVVDTRHGPTVVWDLAPGSYDTRRTPSPGARAQQGPPDPERP